MARTRSVPKTITVFGGSGFVGRHVTRALARRGYRVRAAVRRPDLAGHLQPLGDVGQITAVQANLRYPDSIDRAIVGADAVINLVAILAEGGRQTFRSVVEFGGRAVAQSCRDAGVPLVHVSAIGADHEGTSQYARSKAIAEDAVREALGDKAIIMRPSIIFGPEDEFFNRFAGMAGLSPALPLIGGGHTKFQPVYVADVAEAIARAIDGELKGGTTYELGGPEVLTFRECMEEMLKVIDRKRMLVSIPWPIAMLQGRVLGLLPNPLLTADQVESLRADNIVSDEAKTQKRTLEGIGIEPASLEAILPTYLWRFREYGQYHRAERNDAA